MERQLAETREYLQFLKEDYDSRIEELRNADQEIRTSNEELSTHHQLLQSTNEELQSRNYELEELNSDLRNLLSVGSIPIVMVDTHLCIRRFNTAAEKLWSMSAAELGTPVGRLRGPIIVPQLEALIDGVLDSLEPEQREIQDRNGSWHSLAIRPYRTLDNRIGGAVISVADIDSLKRSQREAEEARDYSEALIDIVREPLLVLDSDLRVEQATPAFYETFQVSRAETEGRQLYDLVSGAWNRPRLRQLLSNALFRDEAFYDYEIEHDFPSIGHKTFRLNARRIANQEPPKVLLAMEDLTHYRQEAEIRYRRLFETAKDGMVVVDDETAQIVDVNPYVLELTGRPRESLIGKEVSALAPAGEFDFHEQVLSPVREKEIVRINKAPLKSRDGKSIIVELIANRYILGARSVVHINLRDITERERGAAALRETQESFRLFVESVREYAMFQTDPAGMITTWNPGAERLLGYTEQEILGRTIDKLFTREDVEKGEPETEREVARERGSSLDVRWHVRKDGSQFFASGILTAVRDDSGRLRGFAKVMRDITAERQAEEQVRQSLKEKDTLLKEIHHRVKNNLQVIISLIQLQSEYVRDSAAVQAFEEMHNRIRSIAAIHELLYASSDISHINFAQYIEKIARDLFAFHHTRLDHVRLRTDISDVALDLTQAVPCGLIVNELLSNSLEHAFPNKRPGLVKIILGREGNECKFSVADNGCGLPAHVDPLDPLQASSMGLQLVRLLVEQLQGRMEVDRSQGTRFTIAFPCKS